ncbi:Cthe_2314 family HEPN domain-containing protein [Priestia megaterium]|uniref:Cthe_2314 family HEPN domain-containing protein n=1 Tax=Priestia megaterium TaxID=1404 RepID=UPI0039E015AE
MKSTQIFDHAEYPTTQEIDVLHEGKEEFFEKMKLDVGDKKTYNPLDIKSVDYSYWLMEYNNRVFDLTNTYAMLMFYYNKGIPDEEWCTSSKEGTGTVYFPHFEEEHTAYHYWFGFYSESYYTRFFGLIDMFYHLANIKYDLNAKKNMKFRDNVLNGLRNEGKESTRELRLDLNRKLKNFMNDSVFKATNKFRKDITHNFRPNQVSSPVKEVKRFEEEVYIYDEQGNRTRINDVSKVKKYEITIGSYTPTKHFVSNIEDSIKFLSNFVEGAKEHFKEPDPAKFKSIREHFKK